ncbi:hypothetical protein BJ684DRAFT_21467 [Piptocephalis cylindrospora]|uniref:Uncharacterized protein n=1 Tax=Piptocephalis cylindrospora TaxID=1907219 RepID=A0A4V1IXR3_9FUNG|nr:hypothetical protein BJ684DRAFT_21467 [Piptocephalis cylindrospora]|eukprot:RKP11959.1 hypothetical protein BJ684DRAFT_21467 [Piptocephalis cylindrospora]
MADRNSDAAGSAPTSSSNPAPAKVPQESEQDGSLPGILKAIDRWIGTNVLGHKPSEEASPVPPSNSPSSPVQPNNASPTRAQQPGSASRASDLIPPTNTLRDPSSFQSPTATGLSFAPSTSLSSPITSDTNGDGDGSVSQSGRETAQPGDFGSDPVTSDEFHCEGIQCPSVWIVIASGCALIFIITTVIFLVVRRKKRRAAVAEYSRGLPISHTSPPPYPMAAAVVSSSSFFTSPRGSLTTASHRSLSSTHSSPAPAHLNNTAPTRGAVEISQTIPTQGVIAMYEAPVFHPPPPPSNPPDGLTERKALPEPPIAYTRNRNSSIPSVPPFTAHSTVTSYQITDPAITRALGRSDRLPSSPTGDLVYVGDAEHREMMEPEVDPATFVRKSSIHPVGEPIAEDKNTWWEPRSGQAVLPPRAEHQNKTGDTKEMEDDEEDDYSAQATPYISSTSTGFTSGGSRTPTETASTYSDTNSSHMSGVSFQSTYTIKSRMSRKIIASPVTGGKEDDYSEGSRTPPSSGGLGCPERAKSFSQKTRDDSGPLPFA